MTYNRLVASNSPTTEVDTKHTNAVLDLSTNLSIASAYTLSAFPS
jgi:hypothetical protein